MKRVTFVFVTSLMVCLARDAAAQVFVNGFVGTTLASPSPSGSKSKPGYGGAIGTMGGLFGVDVDVAYFPELLDNSANGLSKSHVITFSADSLIGPTIHNIKPYGAIGAGSLHVDVSSVQSLTVPNPQSISSNYFTFDVGGGVIGFFSKHFGVRGDIRYYRAFGFNTSDLEGAGLSLNQIDFWRASIGVVATP